MDLGRVAYEAYCVSADHQSAVSGQPLPTWAGQRPEIRVHWHAAALAVAAAVCDGILALARDAA